MYTNTGLLRLSEKLNKPHLEKFTVTDICFLLNKTENQFYKLYDNKADFLFILVKVALKNSLWLQKKDEPIEKTILHVLLNLKRYKYFFINIAKFIGAENHEDVKIMIESEFEQYFTAYIARRDKAISSKKKIRLAAMKTYFILSTWLKGGCKERPELILSLLEDVCINLSGKKA